MSTLREQLPPRLVLRTTLILFVLAGFLSFLASYFPGQKVGAASLFLPKNERLEVNLSGTFEDVDGKSVSFDRFEDEVVLLNFWATWCMPCLIEMPSMAQLQEEFGGKGLRIVAISDEDELTIRQFHKENPFPFTFLIDRERVLFERLRVFGIPLTIILDRDGKLTYFHRGMQVWDTPEIRQGLSQLIDE